MSWHWAILDFFFFVILAGAARPLYRRLRCYVAWQLAQGASDPRADYVPLRPVFKYNFRGGNAHQRRIMRRERERWARKEGIELLLPPPPGWTFAPAALAPDFGAF